MLIAISRQDESLSANILTGHGLDVNTLTQRVIEKNPKGQYPSNIFSYSENVKAVLEESIEIARSLDFEFVGVEHVLIAIMSKESIATDILQESGMYQDTLINEVVLAKNKFDLIKKKVYEKLTNDNEEDVYEKNIYRKSPKMGNFLQKYTTDITNKAENEEMDVPSQRDEEIQAVIRVLSRRDKNSPVLVGEAGVGKTSIVNALAYKIVNDDVPESLKKKRILSVNMPLLMSGSKYKGELEERIKNLLEDAKKNANVILFIDNFHSVAILSNQDSTSEAGTMLKNALSESQIQIIGATSVNEYKKYIEKDELLKRRIQTITVQEPSEEKAVSMIKSIIKNYEQFHDVKIDDDIIQYAVNLSKKHINYKYLPDKAIDLIDEASSMMKLSRDEQYFDIDDIFKNISDAKFKITRYVNENNLKNVSVMKDEISQLEQVMDSVSDDSLKIYNEKKYLSKEYIEKVISNMTGIPLERLSKSEEEKLLNMRENLSKNVIGQEKAISVITRAIQRARVGLKDDKKPIGSFIFVGPTGVGKTKLAKMLAKELFDDEDAIIKIDMSEYSEKYNVSKMIGSAPGYVGYLEGGQLTEKVSKKPYCVLLFDEIEKAHPDIFDILLQVLDDGYLTDNRGKKVSFRNTIIIMTSNLGSSSIKNQKNFGFVTKDIGDIENNEKIFLQDVKKYFKVEFINRLDDIIVFNCLGKNELRSIIDIQIQEINERLKSRNISIKLDEKAIDYVLDMGYDKEYGARKLSRTIQNLIEYEIAQMILKKEIKDGSVVNISKDKEKLSFEKIL